MLAAGRLHGDDTIAKGKTVTARCWTHLNDDRTFGACALPAALLFYARDRSGEHPRSMWPPRFLSWQRRRITNGTSAAARSRLG